MKSNKILLIALPLLLAATGCNNNHGGYHYDSEEEHSTTSQSSESGSEKKSSEEEPLPTKTPEELEAESRQAFATASNLLATCAYRYYGEGYNSYDVSGIIGNGVRITSRYDAMYDRTFYQGYFANKNGVLSFNGNQGYWNFQPNGYALKTNSLEDSINFVENWMPRFALNENQWTYIGNTNGVSVFKTTSDYVHKYISLLETGSETARQYTDIYATINTNGDFIQINTQATIAEISNYINFYGFNNLWDSKDGSSQQDCYDALFQKDFLDNDWDFNNFHLSGLDRNYVPFPTFGDRYYFMDWVGDEWAFNGGQYERYHEYKVGFINTGNRITDYAAQLIEFGYQNEPGETTKFVLGYDHISLTFVTPEETGHADLYPQGIFYINHYTEVSI